MLKFFAEKNVNSFCISKNANILAEKKCEQLLHLQKLLTFFSAKIPTNQVLYLLEQIIFWPLMSLLS